MAVKRRLKLPSGGRVDSSHLRLIESSVTGDFDDLLRGLITGSNSPYIIRGFDIVSASATPNGLVTNLQLNIADAAVLHSTATEAGTILRLAQDAKNIQLNTSNPNLIGGWTANSINYVSLDYRRAVDSNSVDQVAVWSPSEDVELQKTLPINYGLDYRIVLSTSGFGNFLPLYIVRIDQNFQIQNIENARTSLLRLGTGGATPNPSNSYLWPVDGSGSRIEEPFSTNLSSSVAAWTRGDYSIKNLKDWSDAVMTRFKEITGSSYWYADANFQNGPINLKDTYLDSIGSVMTSDGSFAFNLELELSAISQNQPTLEATINDPANFVNILSYDGASNNIGRGRAVKENGALFFISGTTGSFDPAAIVPAVSVQFTMAVPSSGISRSGTTATINILNALLFSSTGASGGTFTGTVTGSGEANFNKTLVTMTVTSPTTATYTVSNSGSTSDSGPIILTGILSTANIVSASAGPLTWSADVVVREIASGREFTLSSTATSTGLPGAGDNGPGSVTFSGNNEVAFLMLDRDLPVGAPGQTYSCSNNGIVCLITGSAFTYTGKAVNLAGLTTAIAIGDYVKFDGESDQKYFKVSNVTSNTLTLVDNNNNCPNNISQRPNVSSVSLVVSRGIYNNLFLENRQDVPASVVPDSGNVYWIALRKDSGTLPVVYLRNLRIQQGESVNINDNQPSNLLLYTGANTESAINPNYSISLPNSPWQFEDIITINSADAATKTVYFNIPPNYGIQQGDEIYDTVNSINLTIAYPLSADSAVVEEDISTFTPSSSIKYRRPNLAFLDTDNLTSAERKVDRLLARIETILNRPVYDESAYVQMLSFTASGGTVIRSGFYIQNGGGGLAWVLAASNANAGVWPLEVVGNMTTYTNKLLIHVISGASTFINGASFNQTIPGNSTQTITQSGVLTSPSLYGDDVNSTGGGQVLKLLPNTRTGIPDSSSATITSNKVWPYASYLQKAVVGGGELLVVANDSMREAGLDFEETLAGPGGNNTSGSGSDAISKRATVRLLRTLPANTRVRIRNLATFGIPSSSTSSSISLQSAYNGGNTINSSVGVPVQITHASPTDTGLALYNGRFLISGASGAGIRPETDLSSSLGFSNLRIAQEWLGQMNLKNHNGDAGSEWISTTSSLVTTNASPNTIFTLAGQDTRAYRMKASIVGRRSNGTAYASFIVEALISVESGVATLVESPVTTVLGSSDAAYFATILVSSANINIAVGGNTGHTVRWVASIDYQSVST